VAGEVLPPAPGDYPIGSTSLSGAVNVDREGRSWTVTLVDIAAEDFIVTIPDIPLSLPVTDVTLTMPFLDVSEGGQDPVTVEWFVGKDDGSTLRFDAQDEVDCSGCDDFVAGFTFSLNSPPLDDLVLMGPISLDMGSADDAITLKGTLGAGFVVVDMTSSLALWFEGDLDLIQVIP